MEAQIKKMKSFLEKQIQKDTDYKYTVIEKHRRMIGTIEERELSFSALLEWFTVDNLEFIRNCNFKTKKMLTTTGRYYKITK